jgi:hypothetical protein
LNSQPLGHKPSALPLDHGFSPFFTNNNNWANIFCDYIDCDNINYDNINCDNIKLDHITYFALSTECEPSGHFSMQTCRPKTI